MSRKIDALRKEMEYLFKHISHYNIDGISVCPECAVLHAGAKTWCDICWPDESKRRELADWARANPDSAEKCRAKQEESAKRCPEESP
jgi:hypothetical protein